MTSGTIVEFSSQGVKTIALELDSVETHSLCRSSLTEALILPSSGFFARLFYRVTRWLGFQPTSDLPPFIPGDLYGPGELTLEGHFTNNENRDLDVFDFGRHIMMIVTFPGGANMIASGCFSSIELGDSTVPICMKLTGEIRFNEKQS